MGSYYFNPPEGGYPGAPEPPGGPLLDPGIRTGGGYPGDEGAYHARGYDPTQPQFGQSFTPLPPGPVTTVTDRSSRGVDTGAGELVRYFDPGLLRRLYETPEIPLPGGNPMGGFLPGIVFPGAIDRGSILGRIGGAVAGAFLPQTDCKPGDTRLECMFYGPPIQTTGPGPLGNAVTSVVRRAAGTPVCTYPTKSGKQRGGQYRIVNGQLVCVPKPRRMSPCNPHAARRAVRRLNMVHSFMRSIEKSMAKACRPTHPRARASGRCGTCRKTKCSC